MFDSPIIEIVLTLTFFYFVLSITASSIYEWFGKISHRRGGFLKAKLLVVFEVLNEGDLKANPKKKNGKKTPPHLATKEDPNWFEKKKERTIFLDELYRRISIHSCADLINNVFSWNTQKPKEINPEVFGTCMLDYLLAKYSKVDKDGKGIIEEETEEAQFKRLQDKFQDLKQSTLEDDQYALPTRFWNILARIVGDAECLDDIVDSMMLWYQEYSNLVVQRYRLQIKPWLAGLGLLMAFLFNVDTIAITKTLWKKEELKKIGYTRMQQNLQAPFINIPDGNQRDFIQQVSAEGSTIGSMKTTDFPIGWYPQEAYKVNNDTTIYYIFQLKSKQLAALFPSEMFTHTKINTSYTAKNNYPLDSLITRQRSPSISTSKALDQIKKNELRQDTKHINYFKDLARNLSLVDLISIDISQLIEEQFTAVPLDHHHLILNEDNSFRIEVHISAKKERTKIASLALVSGDSLVFNFKLHQLGFEYHESDAISASIHELSATAVSIRLDVVKAKKSRYAVWWMNLGAEVWRQFSLIKFLGWMITAIAIAIVAPFCYDVLKRISSLVNKKRTNG
jgi:uncharacterized membrane protein YidH (DUF202 family)